MRIPIEGIYIELSEETLLRLAHRLDAEKRVHETRTVLAQTQQRFAAREKNRHDKRVTTKRKVRQANEEKK
jgi:hypothetical protein